MLFTRACFGNSPVVPPADRVRPMPFDKILHVFEASGLRPRVVILALGVLFGVVPAAANAAALARAKELYGRDCISCHGADGRGVAPTARRGQEDIQIGGPPLIGTGRRGAHFYLSTGYMPLTSPGEQPTREEGGYSGAEIAALIDFVGRFGGPDIPEVHPERGDPARGLRLFTESCAGCHQIVGEGGILPGAVPPELKHSTPTQIAEAIRIGPYVMPRYSEEVLDDRDVDSIVAYLLAVRQPEDRGGWGIGHIGPVSEGLVAWLLAGTALVITARLIGQRTP